MAPFAGVVAHGGTAGAVVEAALALAVVAVLVAVWLRERHRSRNGEDDGPAELRDGEQG